MHAPGAPHGADRSASGHRNYNPRAVWGWAIYDFANSAYTTLIVTFIYAVFFTDFIVGDPDRGTTLWGYGVTVTAILVALSSPVLGALADRGGYRRRFLVASTVVTVVFVCLLAIPGQGDVTLALLFFVVSNVAFELSSVFYNSYLPEVAPPSRIGRISGYGWALGYLGGLLAMAVALFVFIQPETPPFGLSKETGAHVRATTVLVGVWFAVLSLPMFLWVKEPLEPGRAPAGRVVRDALARLKTTFREIRDYRQVFRLLVARLVYNDGLVTIFAFGPVFAAGTFGFTIEEVLYWGLALNLTAGLGAFAMGFLDDRVGGKRTVLLTLAGLLVGSLWAVTSQSKLSLWLAGLFVGIWVGPNQAASRSLLGRFIPRQKESEFYGFYAFSGKATAFMGPALLATVTGLADQRLGMSTIVVFFLVGALILLPLDEGEGVRKAEEKEKELAGA